MFQRRTAPLRGLTGDTHLSQCYQLGMALRHPITTPQATSHTGGPVEPPQEPQGQDEPPHIPDPDHHLFVREGRVPTLRVAAGAQRSVVPIVHTGGDVVQLKAAAVLPSPEELEPWAVAEVLPQDVVRYPADVTPCLLSHEDRPPLLGLVVTQPVVIPQPLDRPRQAGVPRQHPKTFLLPVRCSSHGHSRELSPLSGSRVPVEHRTPRVPPPTA